MLRPSIASLLIALSFTPGAASAQSVLVVDDQAGPGVDFTSLGAAVAAASNGDTILVRAGTYSGANIVAKSLAVVADPKGASVLVQGGVSVRQLSDHQFVSLAGLFIDAGLGAGAPQGLRVEDNLGHVWLEDCTLHGPDYIEPLVSSGPGVVLSNSAHVTLIRCEVLGGMGGPFTGIGVAGMLCFGQRVNLFDSRIYGGASVCDENGCPSESAAGMAVVSGTAFIEGSELNAGHPGSWCSPSPPICFPGGMGSALFVYGSNPVVTLFDNAMLGDPPVQVLSGTTVTLPGLHRDLLVSSPARSGEPLWLGFDGFPGDLVFVLVGLSPADVFKAQLKGPLLVGSPSSLFALGVVPPEGVLTVNGTGPHLPPTFESLSLALQAAFVTSGGAMCSDPARLVLLNAGF